jgi:hypothetical protein
MESKLIDVCSLIAILLCGCAFQASVRSWMQSPGMHELLVHLSGQRLPTQYEASNTDESENSLFQFQRKFSRIISAQLS